MISLSQKKLFLFDLDGTLSIGDRLYEGSRELLSYIASAGGKSYYITNNSTMSAEDYIRKFRKNFGLTATADQFVTAGYMTLRFLKKNFPADKIFVLGTKSFIKELKNNGLNITEEAEENISCAVAAYDSELTYEKLCRICRVLFTQDIPFYATNPDLRCPIDFGFIPDCGSICNMITAATGRKPIYLGKPSKEIVTLCMERSGFSPEETLVVGDRIYTDIACGINAGVDTCVVYTGEASPEEVKTSPYRPAWAFENIADLWKAIKEAAG